MAFSDYLLKSGNDIFPHELIAEESYKIKPTMRQALDPLRDTTGLLHLKMAPRKVTEISFETVPLDNTQVGQLMTWLKNHYADDLVQSINLRYWNEKKNDYSEDLFYLVDPEFNIDEIDRLTHRIFYKPTTINFIGYGQENE